MTDREPAFYLSLFHGRTSPDESLDTWGTDGPIIGPFDYVCWTYGRLRFGTHERGEIELSRLQKNGEEGLVFFEGIWYGDFTILDQLTLDACDDTDRLRLMSFVELDHRLDASEAAEHFIQFPDYQI